MLLQGVLPLTLCLPRPLICTSVNLPRSPICTVIHMPYCSFVLRNEAITIVSGSHCTCVINLAFGFFHTIYRKKIQRLKIVFPKWSPNSRAPQNNVARGGGGGVCGKQRVDKYTPTLRLGFLTFIGKKILLFKWLNKFSYGRFVMDPSFGKPA